MMINSKNLLKDLMIFDAHCDTAIKLLKNNYDFKKNIGHLDSRKIIEGGLNAQIFALYVDPLFSNNNPSAIALEILSILEKKLFLLGFGNKVSNISQMDFCIKKNTLACWIFIEGGHIIENSFDKIDLFHSLGLRGVTITHNKNTDWADSSSDKPEWHGLNELGYKILNKFEELNIIIDVSHASDDTVDDVLNFCSKPIMASHSNSRYLCNIKRNLPDRLISEIGEIGGYVGVNFFPGFLKKKLYDQIMNNYAKNQEDYQIKLQENKDNFMLIREIDDNFSLDLIKNIDRLDLNSVIDHIEHISNVGGIDCVGLGSDFDGIPGTPVDLKDVSFYPNLVDGLFERGFKLEEIKKIMGLNLYNFFKKF